MGCNRWVVRGESAVEAAQRTDGEDILHGISGARRQRGSERGDGEVLYGEGAGDAVGESAGGGAGGAAEGEGEGAAGGGGVDDDGGSAAAADGWRAEGSGGAGGEKGRVEGDGVVEAGALFSTENEEMLE